MSAIVHLGILSLKSFAQTTAPLPFPNHAVDEWVWVDIEGSICMDGKVTGVYVKFGSGTGVGTRFA